jgi:hypothetical protein
MVRASSHVYQSFLKGYYYLVVNPVSGRGNGRSKQIRQEFRSVGNSRRMGKRHTTPTCAKGTSISIRYILG